MLNKSKQLYVDCKLYCNNFDTSDDTFKLGAIYYKQSDIKAVATNKDSSKIIIFDPYKEYEFAIYDTLYNFDDFDFDILENGYKIDFMSIEHHYNFWESISDIGIESFNNKIGIQNYIKFCIKNNVNNKTIANESGLNVSTDILQYYKKSSIVKVSNLAHENKRLCNKKDYKNRTKKGVER